MGSASPTHTCLGEWCVYYLHEAFDHTDARSPAQVVGKYQASHTRAPVAPSQLAPWVTPTNTPPVPAVAGAPLAHTVAGSPLVPRQGHRRGPRTGIPHDTRPGIPARSRSRDLQGTLVPGSCVPRPGLDRGGPYRAQPPAGPVHGLHRGSGPRLTRAPPPGFLRGSKPRRGSHVDPPSSARAGPTPWAPGSADRPPGPPFRARPWYPAPLSTVVLFHRPLRSRPHHGLPRAPRPGASTCITSGAWVPAPASPVTPPPWLLL